MAHADNVIAVLGVIVATTETTIRSGVRRVGNEVDTVHATVGRGRVLVPLYRRKGPAENIRQ